VRRDKMFLKLMPLKDFKANIPTVILRVVVEIERLCKAPLSYQNIPVIDVSGFFLEFPLESVATISFH
jgi:hypothetical protein